MKTNWQCASILAAAAAAESTSCQDGQTAWLHLPLPLLPLSHSNRAQSPMPCASANSDTRTHLITLCICKLRVASVNVCQRDSLPATKGLLLVAAIEEVLQLCAHKRSSLAGLHVQKLCRAACAQNCVSRHGRDRRCACARVCVWGGCLAQLTEQVVQHPRWLPQGTYPGHEMACCQPRW